MGRMRISTTVEDGPLLQLRSLLSVKDSELLDRALKLLLRHSREQQEREALARQPYDEDESLSWEAPRGEPLPYEGAIPAAVLQLWRERRERQQR